MGDLLIRSMEMPKNCVKCEWRDAETGGDCELMIRNLFETYTEQYKHCPFQVISKRYSLVPVSPHGDLIERKAICLTDFEIAMCNGDYKDGMKMLLEKIESAPTIIPASE